MQKRIIIARAALALLFSSSCATIFHGTSQQVMIESDPPGANVRMGPFTGKTPMTVTLSKGHEYPIQVTKDGYQEQVTSLQKGFDGLAALNLIFIPGWIIDIASGAAFEYDPDTYSVTAPAGSFQASTLHFGIEVPA